MGSALIKELGCIYLQLAIIRVSYVYKCFSNCKRYNYYYAAIVYIIWVISLVTVTVASSQIMLLLVGYLFIVGMYPVPKTWGYRALVVPIILG